MNKENYSDMPLRRNIGQPLCTAYWVFRSVMPANGSRPTPMIQQLPANSSNSSKCRSHWFNLRKGDNQSQHKQFSEDSARPPEVAVYMQVVMSPYSGAIPDAILHECISPRHGSHAHMDSLCGFDSASIASSRAPRLTNQPSSVSKGSARIPPPAAAALVVPTRPLLARPGESLRSGGLSDFWPSPNSNFPFASEYISRFRDWLDGHRFAALPGVPSFHGRSKPSGVNRKSFASAWRKIFLPCTLAVAR